MSPPIGSIDKTNFAQSLMHMVKGNLGTGVMAMPMSFKRCGLLTASFGLPLLCFISTFCVHLLVRSSQHLENKMKWTNLDYASLAKGAFKAGPKWMRSWSGVMCRVVDTTLIISQIGICCVYLVFIVDNIEEILKYIGIDSNKEHVHGLETTQLPMTYNVTMNPSTSVISHSSDIKSHDSELISKPYLFLCILPFVLLISYITTLRSLSIASACANIFQVVGISIIVVNLAKGLPSGAKIENFSSIREVALGFGSAMFAFEGISVVLPVYTRMKRPEQMGGSCGLINVSYTILLMLYFVLGTLGYLRFGNETKGSITLNLHEGLLSRCLQSAFAMSIFLTYPLQFYVPCEILWNWLRLRMFGETKEGKVNGAKFEYLFRTLLVLFTFILAITIPKLELLMGLVGSISGTALSITLPAIIHLATFWDDVSGSSKVFMILTDSCLILISLVTSLSGSYFSLEAILYGES